jgi:glycosyltransferase involved in cell wall biosynthesis
MNNFNPPIASVCIPTYNSQKYIGTTIQSALSQTYQDVELIIVDDCSTDKTLDIIREFKDSRIILMENKTNLGSEKNWNKAIFQARGKYIKLLHHDDFLYPTCLEKQVSILDDPDHQDVVLVSCSRDIIDESGKKILKRGFKNKKGKFPGPQIIKETLRSGTNLIGEPTSVLFRSETLNKIGRGFDGSIPYLIDLDLWCRLLLHGNIFIIHDPLCTFRISSTSWSVNIRHLQRHDFKDFISKLYRNKDFHLTWYDSTLGKIKADMNGFLRYMFYKFILKKKGKFNFNDFFNS